MCNLYLKLVVWWCEILGEITYRMFNLWAVVSWAVEMKGLLWTTSLTIFTLYHIAAVSVDVSLPTASFSCRSLWADSGYPGPSLTLYLNSVSELTNLFPLCSFPVSVSEETHLRSVSLLDWCACW